MPKEECKHIDLALQGGGSHGALTWGVLDRLLEEERLEIDGVSGTSAGAMNAVVLADGLHRGGREGAREALHHFWRGVSDAARFSPIQPTPWDWLTGTGNLDYSPSYLMFESLTQLVAPAKLNPLGFNPLRDLVCELVDFERVNACRRTQVYVTATNVRTGRAKIFHQPEITVDTVMASACLPFMFPAVMIDGEAYWDGGYSGNPALFPLVDNLDCQDLVVVQVNPLVRNRLPDSARDIVNRINEITFNSSLIKELRSIQLLQQLIDAEGLEVERYRSMRLHLIHAEQEVEQLSASSKLNAQWDFVSRLYRQGRGWAELWLEQNFEAIGKHSTFDLNAVFGDGFRPVSTAEKRRDTRAHRNESKT
ncbi:patatin-like phospholipase family protein [Halomonas sp. MCCC 1A11036]|uniref:Patatin-like phospholipase family protein n=1 Tax=Billgrantia zhangzhouensis TaxID=2733481 RepID=A0ABS9AHF5_9GAMM|nr:patatin-like phospholipase family protein [Halomonas zhangzhouensis]MCE8021126.1 patatin-like phospholipase family protein [Halomonas zhangzhouensis]